MDTTIADHVALRRINDSCVTTCLILRTWNTHGIRNMGMRQSINAPCAFNYPHLLACKIPTTWKIQTSNVHQRHLVACLLRLCHTDLQRQLLPRLSTLNSMHPRQSSHPTFPSHCRIKQGEGHQTHRTQCLKSIKAHRSSGHTQIAHVKALCISYLTRLD